MFLIYNLNDNIILFDVTVFLDISAVGLVILLEEGCDLYKSQTPAGFVGRGNICFLAETHIPGALPGQRHTAASAGGLREPQSCRRHPDI